MTSAEAGTYSVEVEGACGTWVSGAGALALRTSPPVITRCASDKALVAINCQAAVPDLTKEIVATDECLAEGLLRVTQVPASRRYGGVWGPQRSR